jgi:hypothetical protein
LTPGLQGGLIAVGAVVVVALLLRNLGAPRGDVTQVPAAPPPPEPPEPLVDTRAGLADEFVDADDDGVDDRLVVAVAGDGSAFVPDRHVVRVLPPEEEGEEWKVGAGIKSSRLRAERALSSMTWHAGDMRGVRVVRGGADEWPWRLEALGRDGDYISFDFETSDAADAARELFQRQGVVELGRDEDGHPAPPSAEQFDEARRISRETEAELGLQDDEDAH